MFQPELTPRASKILHVLAKSELKRLNHELLLPEHILLSLIQDEGGIAVKALTNLGANLVQLKNELEASMEKRTQRSISIHHPISPRIEKILKLSSLEAHTLGHNYIGTEHLLLGILQEENSITTLILQSKEINIKKIRSEIIRIIEQDDSISSRNTKIQSSKTPQLDQFSRDLTAMAQKTQLDPIIGRSKEIERVMQILSRKKKNNPLLIGKPGVGKTAIIEGLANNISKSMVPETLIGKRLIILDLVSVVAGTKYRGEFEERLKSIIKEVQNNKQIILFIDEIHTIIGAGGAEGSIDAANILKPSLARGEMQCIGATTLNEYKKYIEKDSALERRFQPVTIHEPSADEAFKILQGLQASYAKHHKVTYQEDSLRAAVTLSIRYITERQLPDKAIDLLDEAGARAKLRNIKRPKIIPSLEKKIQIKINEKEECVKNQDYELAAQYRDEVNELRESLNAEIKNWQANIQQKTPRISAEDIATIVSLSNDIPLCEIKQAEANKLLSMEKELCQNIIGQTDAVASVCNAIRRSRTGIQTKKKPIGSFLFLGPTGVGKTHVSKMLTKYLFGNENAMIRIDMSEFMQKHAISRLIGSPPGYVGYEHGGELTQKIRRQPYSVILLDEIEKAHPDVLNLLLQLLEEGELTDSSSLKVNFQNTIIIMTSNVGSKEVINEGSFGFTNSYCENSNFQEIKEEILQQAEKTFSPEFINRIDEIIVFQPLKKEYVYNILTLMLNDINTTLSEKNIVVQITAMAKNWIIKNSFNKKMGVRPLRKFLQKHIENVLASKILSGNIVSGSIVEFSCKNNKLQTSIQQNKPSNSMQSSKSTLEVNPF